MGLSEVKLGSDRKATKESNGKTSEFSFVLQGDF